MPRSQTRHPATPATHPQSDDGEECILVLQGGGALGAYQAGVFEALGQAHGEPDWVAGISIGAINAALIAGNPAGQRVARLREFWALVSASIPHPVLSGLAGMRGLGGLPAWPAMPGLPGLASAGQLLHGAAASQVMLFGVPGFFSPRLPPAPLRPSGSPGATSFYDTTPLRATLERLVDFDRINAGAMRLSVGAVNVRSGNFAYFDSARQRLDARHIMASGALPPGFAPVEIDGEFYWDGGLVSNTPLQYVLVQPGQARRTVFQVDLFPASGALPGNLDEVAEREKDIRFSSRTRLNTHHERELLAIAQAARRLMAKLPPALRDDPDLQALAGARCPCLVDVVHLIYRARQDETQSKDYEFSRLSMQAHWDTGRADMARTLGDSRWTGRGPNTAGVRVFDLA